jgi:hypothetical protein
VVSVTPRPRFTPGERTPGTHWTGGWVGPRRQGKDTLPLPGIESRSPRRPACSHDTILPELSRLLDLIITGYFHRLRLVTNSTKRGFIFDITLKLFTNTAISRFWHVPWHVTNTLRRSCMRRSIQEKATRRSRTTSLGNYGYDEVKLCVCGGGGGIGLQQEHCQCL